MKRRAGGGALSLSSAPQEFHLLLDEVGGKRAEGAFAIGGRMSQEEDGSSELLLYLGSGKNADGSPAHTVAALRQSIAVRGLTLPAQESWAIGYLMDLRPHLVTTA